MSDTTTEDPTPTVTPTPADLPAVDTTPEPAVEVKTFTQEDVDRILAQRLGRAQKDFEKQLEEMKATADMTAAEAAEHKAKQALEEKAAIEATLTQTRVEYAVRFAAIAAGVPADQVDAVVRLADTANTVTEDGVNDDAVREAVTAVIAKYPGLAATTPQPAAPVGAGPATADPVKPQADNLIDAITSLYSKGNGAVAGR